MTIKIKAQTVWLDKAWLTEYVGKRLDEREKKYRAVRESDWRKLMKLVKVMESHCAGSVVVCDVCNALQALKGKGK